MGGGKLRHRDGAWGPWSVLRQKMLGILGLPHVGTRLLFLMRMMNLFRIQTMFSFIFSFLMVTISSTPSVLQIPIDRGITTCKLCSVIPV